MSDCFVVDWQVAEEGKQPTGSVVSVRMQGRKAGLYRVKRVMQEGILLSHGAISFPVGTHLDIEDLPGIPSDEWKSMRVVANDRHGVCLAWSRRA